MKIILHSLTIDGFKVLIGRNNTQNDSLTFHKAAKTDLWFHVKDLPGSHVVLVTNGETVPEDTINKTASIAAFYSKGKDSGKTAVDYTYIKYVKRMPNSTPGHVIFTHHKTIMAEPKEFK